MRPAPNRQHLLTLVRSFKAKKVLVVGDVMLDLYVEGPPRFVSQEAPVIVVRVDRKYYKLGGAANSAENIKALGGHPVLAGVVGHHDHHDDVGRSLLQTVKASGLSSSGLMTDPTRPTTLKMRVLSQNQQIVRVDEEMTTPVNRTVERKLIQFILRTLPQVDTVLVSDYQKGVITPQLMKKLMGAARRLGKAVVVDPRPEHRDLYVGVDMITPNEHELSHMFGHFEVVQQGLISLAKQLQKNLGIANVLLTRGERGMDLVDAKGVVHHFPSLATVVRDVSGAGDTVAAVMALGIGQLAAQELAYLAAVAASISVSKPGTATVSNLDLIRMLSQPVGARGKNKL